MNILLVMDESGDRQDLQRLLRDELSCEINAVASADEAEELLQVGEESYDVVLLDRSLPGQGHLDLCHRLNQREQAPPMVIITDAASEALAAQAVKEGVDDYLVSDDGAASLGRLPGLLTRVVQRHSRHLARLSTEQKLREVAAKREALIESLPLGVISLSRDFKVEELNPLAESLTGFSQEDSLGDPCEEVMRCDVCGDECPLVKAIASRRPVGPIRTELLNRQGRRVPVSLMAAGIFDDAGRLLGGVEIIQDLSRVRNMEMERANLLSMLVHDMKTPLVSIKGFARLLLDRGDEIDLEKRERYLRVIFRQTDHLKRLIDELLTSSRQKAGALVAKAEPVDLVGLAGELVAEYRSPFKERGVDLVMVEPPDLESIAGDAKGLRRALANILDNALEHSFQGGVVEVSLRRHHQAVEVMIRDQGEGIPPADLPYIFQPFFRGGSEDEEGRYGLGLAGVKAIIESHDGEVKVSSNPGRGSVFSVILPRMRLPWADQASGISP